VLVFHEDTNTIELETVIPFEHREVYALKSSPYNSSIFAASYVGNAEDNDRAEICITQFNQGSIEETKDEEIY
jgi:WD40 repeat protein